MKKPERLWVWFGVSGYPMTVASDAATVERWRDDERRAERFVPRIAEYVLAASPAEDPDTKE